MATGRHDKSHTPVLMATSSADGITPIAVYANPDTHRLLTGTTTLSGPGTSTDDALVRWNGTTGLALANSLATLTDAGLLDTVAYSVGGTPGADGTFTSDDGKEITVVKGLITSIV